ncbi:MAG: DUF1015 family protein [Planctomycetota bacterium]
MVSIRPIAAALVPINSAAAAEVSGPNYDEFQSEEEIRTLVRAQPHSILRVTMAHCDVHTPNAPAEGSPAALELAKANLSALRNSPRMRITRNVLWICACDTRAPNPRRQIGLGGLARTAEIRTDKTQGGVIIRNEDIIPAKADGRARLIDATRAYTDCVNNAVEDSTGALQKALEHDAGSRPPNYEAQDDGGNWHRIWLIENDALRADKYARLLAAEPFAYVADGNHRSAAAAMLGRADFLTVFFPMRTMRIAPYNRLVKAAQLEPTALERALGESFLVEKLGAQPNGFQPERTHEIGLYTAKTWYKLRPKPSSYDPKNAAQDIDADIVQRCVFAPIFQLTNPRDPKFTFVGGNRDAAYLQQQVNAGQYGFAVTLPPVTLEQFAAVCRQNRMMPPKSTWFVPKVQSGLVTALFD